MSDNYKLQLDVGYNPPRLIRSGSTLDYNFVVNPARTNADAYSDFDEDPNYRQLASGMTLTKNGGIYTLTYSGTARRPVGFFAVKFKMPSNTAQRGLNIAVSSPQSGSDVVFWQSNNSESYTSYRSPCWFLLPQTNAIMAGSSLTIPYPDFRCRCIIEAQMGDGTPKQMTITFSSVATPAQ